MKVTECEYERRKHLILEGWGDGLLNSEIARNHKIPIASIRKISIDIEVEIQRMLEPEAA